MDHPKRSLIKSITWRVIALLITIIVVYIYNKDFKKSLIIGLNANFIKIFLYYIHERIWNNIKFGIVKKPEYNI